MDLVMVPMVAPRATPPNASQQRRLRTMRRRAQRGIASTEYLVLLSAAAIAIVVGVLGWGPPLVRSFSHTRTLMVSPVP